MRCSFTLIQPAASCGVCKVEEEFAIVGMVLALSALYESMVSLAYIFLSTKYTFDEHFKSIL